MSLILRVKRLWALSGKEPFEMPVEWAEFLTRQTRNETPPTTANTTGQELTYVAVEPKPKGMATIMMDDPLDVFPSEDPDHEGDIQ